MSHHFTLTMPPFKAPFETELGSHPFPDQGTIVVPRSDPVLLVLHLMALACLPKIIFQGQTGSFWEVTSKNPSDVGQGCQVATSFED